MENLDCLASHPCLYPSAFLHAREGHYLRFSLLQRVSTRLGRSKPACYWPIALFTAEQEHVNDFINNRVAHFVTCFSSGLKRSCCPQVSQNFGHAPAICELH
jgi:hypothetical protein